MNQFRGYSGIFKKYIVSEKDDWYCGRKVLYVDGCKYTRVCAHWVMT